MLCYFLNTGTTKVAKMIFVKHMNHRITNLFLFRAFDIYTLVLVLIKTAPSPMVSLPNFVGKFVR